MKKSAKFKKIIGIVNCSSPYLIIHLESKFEETIYAELSSDSFPINKGPNLLLIFEIALRTPFP